MWISSSKSSESLRRNPSVNVVAHAPVSGFFRSRSNFFSLSCLVCSPSCIVYPYIRVRVRVCVRTSMCLSVSAFARKQVHKDMLKMRRNMCVPRHM